MLVAQLEEARGSSQDGASSPRAAEEYPNHVRTVVLQEKAVLTAQETSDGSSSENDPLQEFLTACCELHSRAWSRSSDLWEAYQYWVKTHQEHHPLSRRAFITQLKRHGCCADRTMSARIWHGIALGKQQSMTEYDRT